jgi:predicted dehydrogenase
MSDISELAVFDPNRPEAAISGVRRLTALTEVDSFAPEFATVSAPTSVHQSLGTFLGERRVPTLIEKPLAHSIQAAEEIEAAFAKSRTFARVGHVERFNPALIELRKKIQAGVLGQVYQVSTRRESSLPMRVSDVGVVTDLGSHDFDLVMWLLESKFERVSGETIHLGSQRFEQAVCCTGRTSSGVVTSHVISWLSPQKVRQVVVTGETGTMTADLLTADLSFVKAQGGVPIEWSNMKNLRGAIDSEKVSFAFEKVEPLLAEFRDFLSGIEGKGSIGATLTEGVEVIRVTQAVLEAAQSGMTCTVTAAKG